MGTARQAGREGGGARFSQSVQSVQFSSVQFSSVQFLWLARLLSHIQFSQCQFSQSVSVQFLWHACIQRITMMPSAQSSSWFAGRSHA